MQDPTPLKQAGSQESHVLAKVQEWAAAELTMRLAVQNELTSLDDMMYLSERVTEASSALLTALGMETGLEGLE